MSLSKPQPMAQTPGQAPEAPMAPPMFANAAQKPKVKSPTATFMGAGSLPQPGQAPVKTLLGQ